MQIIQRIKYLGKNIGLENAQKGDLRLPYWLIDKYNFSVLLFLTSVSMLTSTPDSIEEKQHTGKKMEHSTYREVQCTQDDDMSF